MMVAMLKPLGIEKGTPFRPDARQAKLLEQAAVAGESMARCLSYAKRQPEALIRPGTQWKNAILLEANQETEHPTALDERTAWFDEAITLSAGMTSKTPGVGQAYIGIQKDKTGQWLQGGNDYTLRVPPNAPAKQLWALTLYDTETRSLIETKHDIGGLDSHGPRSRLVRVLPPLRADRALLRPKLGAARRRTRQVTFEQEKSQ